MTPPHVLVVEDDPASANIIVALARRLGTTVTALGDGISAIQYLTGRPPYHLNPFPSLVILDLGLPGADGFEVLDFMSTSRLIRVAPVLVLSGTTEPQDERTCLELGAQVFLKKPADPRTLAVAISELLRLKERTTQNGTVD